jgi:plasmid stabilization system protein ParE
MSYQVRLLARACDDLDVILTYVAERSPQGAARLSESFEKAMLLLETNPFLSPLAPESEELKRPIRHIVFRTRAGRTYRALYTLIGDEIRVLRVRGAGQPNVSSEDIDS